MIFTFSHKKISKLNGILKNTNSHLISNLNQYSRMKIFSIYILIIIFCTSLVQANDKYNENNKLSNSDHRHHHHHHNHHPQQQYLRNHHDMINSNKSSWHTNERIPNASNINLDRRKIFNISRPLKQSLTTSNSLQLNLFKRNSNVNNNINRTGNNFMELNNDKKNIKMYDRLNSKLLTNINSGYKTYNSVSNQDNQDNVLHDVEFIKRRWNDENSDVFTTPTVTTTTTTAMPTITSKGKTFTKMNDGRHICVQHKTVQIPVKTREIYSRPTWKHVTEPCEENQICTRVQLVHEPVYRDIVRHKSTRQVTYECCPGWEPTTKNANSCMKPVCKVKCKNSGTCIKPDTCNCPRGYTGKFCEQDINECKTEKPCDQLCFNTEGSYYCQCREGFILMSDQQSCKKINGIDKNDDAFEARDLENDVDNTDMLNTRIEKLEKMIANERITTNELYKNYQVTSHLVDSLKTRLSTLEKQQQDINHLQDKLSSNDSKTKTLEYLVNILLKCQKNPSSCQQI